MPGTRVGIDVSGTHVSLCLLDAATGETFTHKTQARPEAPLAAIGLGLEELLQSCGMTTGQVTELVHSTTLPLDLVQARKGAKVGLLVTKGFEQAFYLTHPPENETSEGRTPLADLSLTRGIAERLSADGNTLVPFDESDAREQVRQLLDAGVESLSVCLMHAYANPSHEHALKGIIRSMNNSIPVVLSSEIGAASGEQQRTLATVVNAYVHQGASHYLSGLIDEMRAKQMAIPVSMMQSTGYLMPVEQAMDTPASMIMGTNAASATGAAAIAATAGYSEALALDMGGAVARISLIRNGLARQSAETVVTLSPRGHGRPVSLGLPSLDVRVVAAGGSSVATPVSSGAVIVGPRAGAGITGADPEQAELRPPSVTDAQLVLGRLRTTAMQAQTQAAESAIARFAQTMGIDRHRAAQGIIDIAAEQIAGPLRSVALEKGLDPARLALLVGGGAGPMHACELSLLTGCSPVVVPRAAGVMAALGLTQAHHARQFVQSVNQVLGEEDGSNTILSVLDHLASQASAWLGSYQPPSAGADTPQSHLQYRAELRYWRESFQISVPVEPDQLSHQAGHAELVAQLGQAHQRRVGITPDDQPVELVSLRAIVSLPADKPSWPRSDPQGADASKALMQHDQVYFDGGFTKTAIYARDRLQAGNQITGPAIVTQADTTTVIYPGFIAEVDAFLNLLIRVDDNQLREPQS